MTDKRKHRLNRIKEKSMNLKTPMSDDERMAHLETVLKVTKQGVKKQKIEKELQVLRKRKASITVVPSNSPVLKSFDGLTDFLNRLGDEVEPLDEPQNSQPDKENGLIPLPKKRGAFDKTVAGHVRDGVNKVQTIGDETSAFFKNLPTPMGISGMLLIIFVILFTVLKYTTKSGKTTSRFGLLWRVMVGEAYISSVPIQTNSKKQDDITVGKAIVDYKGNPSDYNKTKLAQSIETSMKDGNYYKPQSGTETPTEVKVDKQFTDVYVVPGNDAQTIQNIENEVIPKLNLGGVW